MGLSDRDLLAKTLMAEAGNQGIGGMMDVGSVIMNRANTTGYGDGVRGVIMKPGQFSAWNGTTGYAGGEQGQNVDAMQPSAEIYKAADMLLSGNYNDQTGGATHYYNDAISQPKWGASAGGNWQRRGDHVFGFADAGRTGATPQPTIGSQAMQVLGKTLPKQQRSGILATPQKGPEPMQQQQPRGLLGSMGIQKMQEGAEGETGQRFYQRDSFKDTAAKMGQAFAALGSNPGVQKFTNDVANQRTESKSRNKTIEYLRANGMADMADMVEAGNLPAGGVLSAIIQKRMATPKDNRTSAQLEYAGAKAQGYGGSFMDYKTALAKSGAINLGGQDVQIVEGKMVVPDPSDPSGYKLVPFGGSKAALAAAEGASRQIVTEKIKGDKATVVNRDIDRLVTMIDGGGTFDLPETGILGGALGKLGVNQEAVDFKNTLASIQGTIAFDTLAKMREASKTGGALGAVSEREIDLLISAFGALQQNTDPTILRENLIDIKRVMGKIENDPVARSMAYGGAGGGAVPPASVAESTDPLNLFGN